MCHKQKADAGPLIHLLHTSHHIPGCLSVKASCWLISKNNIRFIDQRPANRNSLFLTSRYSYSLLPDNRRIVIGKLHDEAVSLCMACGIDYFNMTYLRLTVGYIRIDGIRKEKYVLKDIGEPASE